MNLFMELEIKKMPGKVGISSKQIIKKFLTVIKK